MKIPSILLCALMLAAADLRAQVVADGATNTLSNVTDTFAGDVTVGTNGSFTLLVISNNALLTNSANGVIGRNATANSNAVELISPTARWLMGNNLSAGNDGSFNRLVVSNGGFVRNNTGFLGPNAAGSNNVAVVTGPGSLWSNASGFNLGFNGSGNQLVVSNGGVLRARASTAGVNFTSSSNRAVVTGPGSLWDNEQAIQFGFGGAGNQLVISNGGVLRSSLGYLGTGAFASNNLAVAGFRFALEQYDRAVCRSQWRGQSVGGEQRWDGAQRPRLRGRQHLRQQQSGAHHGRGIGVEQWAGP